jgi:co-chaperonin GroES (HSP10)
MSTIFPRNGLVTVKVIEAKEAKTAHGIFLPTNQGSIFEMARIVEVGRGFPDAGKYVGTDDLREGMLVVIKSGHRQDMGTALSRFEFGVRSDKEKVNLINQQDIVAVVIEDQVMIPCPASLA